jgi:hypothetical protein
MILLSPSTLIPDYYIQKVMISVPCLPVYTTCATGQLILHMQTSYNLQLQVNVIQFLQSPLSRHKTQTLESYALSERTSRYLNTCWRFQISLSDRSSVGKIICAVRTQMKPTFRFCDNIPAEKYDYLIDSRSLVTLLS